MERDSQREDFTLSRSGAYLDSPGTVRRMKSYRVTENELRHISILNAGVVFFLGVAVNAALLAIGLKWDAIVEGVLTSEADLLIRVAFPVLILICVVAIILAGVLYKAQRSSIQTIKEETRDISGLVVDTEEPQIPAAS